MAKYPCNVCGHDMKDLNGYRISGVGIRLPRNSEGKRAEEEFGDTEFHVCYVCRLKSLGIKKPKKEQVKASS